MKKYNKLVRNKIPNIIERSGREVSYRVVEDDEEYYELLKDKLLEEVQEFITEPCIEELADVYEVINALLVLKGVKLREMFEVALRKRKYAGSFSGRVFLEECEESVKSGKRPYTSK